MFSAPSGGTSSVSAGRNRPYATTNIKSGFSDASCCLASVSRRSVDGWKTGKPRSIAACFTGGRCKAFYRGPERRSRLRIDADDFTSRVQKRYECGHGELGASPMKNSPQWRQFMSISSHRIAPTHSTLRTPIRYCGSALRRLS